LGSTLPNLKRVTLGHHQSPDQPPGEAFDRDRGSCLWLVGRLEVLLTALRSLGDLLEKLRSAEHLGWRAFLGKDVNLG